MFPWINLFLLLYGHCSLPLSGSHHNKLACDQHYLKYLIMSSDNWGQNADTKAPLSYTDLAKYLMNDSFTKVQELRQNIKEDLDADREHNKNVIRTVVTGFCKRLDTLEGLVRGNADSTEAVKDLDLKLTTISTYNEELIHGLLQKVHNLSNELQQHAQPLQLIKCGFCGSSFNSSPDLNIHIHQHHTQLNTLLCTGCGYVFRNENDLGSHQCGPSHQMVQDYSTTLCQVYPGNNLNPQAVHSNFVHADVQLGSLYCYKCGQIFHSEDALNHHLETHYGPGNFMCDICGVTFCTESLVSEHIALSHQSSSHELPEPVLSTRAWTSCTDGGYTFTSCNDLEQHQQTHHSKPACQIHCHFCDATFGSMGSLNIHTANSHSEELDPLSKKFPCDNCAFTGLSKNEVDKHIKSIHGVVSSTTQHADTAQHYDVIQSSEYMACSEHSQPFILQVDGIDDSIMTDVSCSGSVSPFPSTPSTVAGGSITYNYALNSQNQTRRLVAGALKEPLSITFNDFKTINNIRYAFNANIECSSGVYLAAIKPVLQTVTTDWTAVVGDWRISCTNVSPRHDSTNQHLVCTQLALIVVPRDEQEAGGSSPHNLTVHFYHTKDKIQVQGSTIISPGLSSPAWLVKHLIEPMAARHITSNQQTIHQINNDIITSVSNTVLTCHSCYQNIDPSAAKVRDQPLTCKNCEKRFHKKCTDRSSSKGGSWNKDPWLCSLCSLSVVLPQEVQSSGPPCIETQPQIPAPTVPSLSLSHRPTSPCHQSSQDLCAINNSDPSSTDPLTIQTSQTNIPTITKFPNNSVRQRKSNVAILEPEVEFQKAAIDACRSTIAQQEAELKRLNECLDLRNKKIIQLESQIGVARSFVASREIHPDISRESASLDPSTNLTSSLSLLLSKLTKVVDNLTPRTSSVNVYNSSCHISKAVMIDAACQTSSSNQDQFITTDTNTIDSDEEAETVNEVEAIVDESEAILTCTICNKTAASSSELDNHIEDAHGSKVCDFCDQNFNSKEKLKKHQNEKHPAAYLQCPSCMLRFRTKEDLYSHVNANHNNTLSLTTVPNNASTL